MKRNFATIRVRYQETDQMGVVYHANYFVWFEVARTELFHTVGLRYTDLEKVGIYVPVVEASCKYISPAHYDEEIDIYPTLVDIGVSKFTITYTVLRHIDSRILAKGKTVHCFIGKDGKPISLKKTHPEFYSKLEAALETSRGSNSSWLR